MKQETFTDIEYSYRKKKTKREEFLEIMEEIIPWDEWVGVIEPYYPCLLYTSIADMWANGIWMAAITLVMAAARRALTKNTGTT